MAFVKGHGLADVTDRVEDHFRLLNEAIRSHDWTAFLATFTSDAAAGVDSSRPGIDPRLAPSRSRTGTRFTVSIKRHASEKCRCHLAEKAAISPGQQDAG